MKRLHLIFAVVVITAFLSAWIVERSRAREVVVPDYAVPSNVVLEELVAPRGDLELRGRVLDAAGSPAAGVSVHLRPLGDPGVVEPTFATRTGADGTFLLRNLPPGTFDVALLATGVPNARFELELPSPEVQWTLAEPFGDVPELPPIRRAPLEGILVPAEAGASLEGYEVQALPRGEEALWAGGFPRGTLTDGDGRFRFEELAVTDYDLVVRPPWAAGGSWPELGSRRALRHAPPPDGATAAPIEIPLDTGRLQGRIVDPRGRGIEGALVRVRDEAGHSWPPHRSDAEGVFRVEDLPAGHYGLTVHAGAAVVEVPPVRVDAGSLVDVPFDPIDPRPESPPDPPGQG